MTPIQEQAFNSANQSSMTADGLESWFGALLAAIVFIWAIWVVISVYRGFRTGSIKSSDLPIYLFRIIIIIGMFLFLVSFI